MKNENESPENQNNKSGISASKTLVAIAAGAAAGAVTALLLAPQTGAETRKVIANRANKVKDNASKIKGDIADTLKQGIDKFNQKTDELKKDIA